MKETQITCTCRALSLPDLNLDLVQGQVVHVDAKAASRSQDLTRARRAGGVSVREVQRVRERRPEGQPPKHVFPRSTRGSKGGAPMPPIEPPAGWQRFVPAPPPTPPADLPRYTLDPNAIRRIPVSESDAPVPRPRSQPFLDTATLREIVRTEVTGALKEAMGTMPAGARVMGVDVAAPGADRTATPTFIPSKILKDDVVADISATTEESDSDSVEAASKALKKRKRPAKKRATRKKGEGK